VGGWREPYGHRVDHRAVTIPVMAKAMIGHFVEARSLEAWVWIWWTSLRCLLRADGNSISKKTKFTIPFVCGARNLGESLQAHQGRGGHDQDQR